MSSHNTSMSASNSGILPTSNTFQQIQNSLKIEPLPYDAPVIKGQQNLLVPGAEEQNHHGKYRTDNFMSATEFDISSLTLSANELLKMKLLESDNLRRLPTDSTVLSSIVVNLEDDLKILAQPHLPAFSHMSLDDIKGTPQSSQTTTSKGMAEGMVGIVNQYGNEVSSSQGIVTDISNIDANTLTNNQLADENFNAIANLIDKNINKSNKHIFTARNMTLEMMKCRLSALYFIENYVSIPVAGGRIPIKESEQWNRTDKYKIIVDLFQQHDAVLYMSSRQSGKTTTSAMYLLWCMIFFPKIQISYLTLDKNRAIDMISRMKEMMDSLPKWLQVKPKSGAERLSYYELINGSKITASFVSGSNDPDKVGRGLSSPIVFIDETAFISHAEIVWGALQPSVSAAKIFAKKNGYPNGVIFTSTPNGAGSNFFYNVYQNSVKFDDIYDYENKRLHENYQQEFKKPEKNSFISVVLHWSEFRTQEWYEEQRKELNFDQRKISQELDLSFLGSNSCVFSDEIIALLIPKKRQHKIQLPYGCQLDLYEEIDPEETYFLGVDTAMSAGSGSDYSAMVLCRGSDGKPIGEWHGRFSVVKRFAQVVKACVKSLKVLYALTPENLKVVIERNSIGKETVEELIYDESNFDYEEYLFHEVTEQGERVPGLYTSNSGKMGQGKRDKMFNMLMTIVNEKPYFVNGPLLIDELRNLEQKVSGRIEASKNQHDDIVMAWNFCLFARKYLIDRGEYFVQGESKVGARVDSDIIGSALGAGTIHLSGMGSGWSGSTSAQIEEFGFAEVDRTKLNKMAGLTKIEIKSIDDERKALLKELGQETFSLSSIFGNTEVGFINNDKQDDNYHSREEFDPSDYMII